MDYARRTKKGIERNPVSDIDVPPVSPGRIRWLSTDERKRLLEACDPSELGAIHAEVKEQVNKTIRRLTNGHDFLRMAASTRH